jgi:hypothetical protein
LSLLAFVGVVDGERVEVMGAAHLGLDGTLGQQEVHDLVDLPRERQKQRRVTTHAGAFCYFVTLLLCNFLVGLRHYVHR